MKETSHLIVKFQNLLDGYIAILSIEANKTSSKIKRDLLKIKILEYSYGYNSKLYTKDDIALLLNITRERVRQIHIDIISEIKETLENKEINIFSEYDFHEIKKMKSDLLKIQVQSQKQFNEFLKEKYNVDIQNNEPIVKLLIDTLNFKLVNIHLHYLKNNSLIFFDTSIDAPFFIKICYEIYKSVEENIILIESNDLIINIKRKFEKTKINNEIITKAIDVIDDLDLITKNHTKFYQITFHKLSSASDMAYRVLFEKKEKMSVTEIHREINHKLSNTDRKAIDKASLSIQLNIDKRLMPMGKTGIWSLKEWGTDNLSMYDLITNTIMHFNRPLTKKEIVSHIQKTRPFIQSRSLATVIYNSKFTQLNGKKFILTEWKDSFKDEIAVVKKRILRVKDNAISIQIKNQIIDLFEQNNTDTLLLSSVANTISKKYKFPKTSVYKVISEEKDFKTVEIDNYRKQVILVNKNQVANPKIRKTTTVFVSYSWENELFKEKIISFINFLRQNGFGADMDIKLMQEETAIDFNMLMHKGLLEYNKIIIILSKSYKEKAESFIGGVGKEYRYIINDINKNPKKYILVSFSSPINEKLMDEIVPLDLKGREIVDIMNDENNNFKKLFSKLTEEQPYLFSDVASETPIIEKKKIDKFTLKTY